jgi:thiamine-monophosphate kinase
LSLQRVEEIGEFGLISKIREFLSAYPSDWVSLSLGDDAACISPKPDYDIVTTCDSAVEKRHFLLSHLTLKEVGRRAMVQNISDIGAMGGIPFGALICLCLPEGFSVEGVMEIYKGLMSELMPFGATIMGGNITKAQSLELHITLLGYVEKGKAVTRKGAKPGDWVLVTGFPGQSFLGLSLLKRGSDEFPKLIDAYKNPRHRVFEARALMEKGIASAMIDISDGLFSDLNHICEESKVGAVIELEQLPKGPQVLEASNKLNLNVDQVILGPSDDYELIFTCHKRHISKAEGLFKHLGVPLSRVGYIKEGSGIEILHFGKKVKLEAMGWDHFISSQRQG